jgi:hypothetical protein
MKVITSLSAPKQVLQRDHQPDTRSKKNIFFNQAIPISELKFLGDIDSIQEEYDQVAELKSWERSRKSVEKWLSKSTSSRPSDPAKFHLELQKLRKVKILTPDEIRLTPPPPGFSDKTDKPVAPVKKRWVDFSSDSDLSGTPIEFNFHPLKIQVQKSEVILQAPPSRPGNIKREKRGKFETEVISEKLYTGKLKFFHLKKRYGFIIMDNGEDVFLVEDQIILSGINYKKFKDDVFNKLPINFRFQIKSHTDLGKEKKIATNIEVIP